ncbi:MULTISPECIES: type II secretion system minor pseudopilin GspI [unclassified Sphingomonas]|jgi:general secretion pathway protein I|uniref:type II secretion system minor pseudopilin GspI n=1 Tax=unclassified Sphingomonas TaxID=196159 RepID=UPI000E10A5D3|nr:MULTISPECIES: type II secretion system minor pseudopilin GspI [unclassified Sphingomonas]AXJ94302.1 type II secretion system protein GspI [Sphingomonas sp. FARSPH]
MRTPAALPLREAGFTLIEIMVALAVFSLAVLALVRLENATVRGATILDDTMIANLVARNVAIEAATEARMPTLGRSSGVETNGGRAWTWVRDVRPTGNASIVRIDVAVADRRGAPIGRATIVRPPDTQP